MQLEWFVVLVVGDDENVVVVFGSSYALDEWALVGVEDVDFVPLEEDVGERYAPACHYVARAEGWLHGVSLDVNEEVGPLECRDVVGFAVVWHDLGVCS